MQSGVYFASDVQAVSSRVLVNGVERQCSSWSVDRELASDLPAGVAGGAGISQATGQVSWVASTDVERPGHNPWNPSTGWTPAVGDRVEIYAGDGVTEWKQFTGRIDSVSGSVNQGFNANLIDDYDDLSVRANIPSLVDVMPPVAALGTWRRFRLTPLWVAMMCLRRAGFYATPDVEASAVFDVPAFGGMWPYQGSMISCHRQSTEDLAPITPYSTHVADVYARYSPTSNLSGADTVQLTMKVAAQHNGIATLQVMYGEANYISLRASATRIYFLVNGNVVVDVPRNGAEVIKGLFKNGNAQVRTQSGQNASGDATTWGVSAPMSEVRVIADAGSVVNGFIVSHPSTVQEFANLDWVPTANIINGVMHGATAGVKASKDQTAGEVLDEISESLLWPYWIDEHGVMQMIASDMLRGGPVVKTMTTSDGIFELGWKRDLLGKRREVITQYEQATVNRRTDYSLPVWESGQSVVLQSGETYEEIIDSGSEEWLMVDTAWKTIAEVNQLNKGVGTWLGGVYTDGATDQWTNADGTVQVDFAFSQINSGVYKFTASARVLDAGKQVELRSVRGDFTGTTVLWPFWWDKNLPIVRAKGKFATTVSERPAVVAAGGKFPVLTHDCKLWATGNNAQEETLVVDRIASFLAEQTSDPLPEITNLRVVFDPRVQLGDVAEIVSPNFLGVTLTALVTQKSVTFGGDGAEMSLSVRIMGTTNSSQTYEGHEQSLSGSTVTYSDFQALGPLPETYSQFNVV